MDTGTDVRANPTEAATPRLPYWAALDGLRGLAVVAVLLFHAGIDQARGGFLGVSLFFTLSGFLITSLALSERSATGTVRAVAFWKRRIRRLLPASLLALVLALVVTMVALPVDQRVDAVGDIRAALLNVANWRFIFEGASYADLDLLPSPVEHYWSLAIEEQFYLVFPLVAAFALRRRARGLALLLGVVVAGSLAAQLVIDDLDRIYFGTDTRAAELALGGLLAIAAPHLHRLLGPHRAAVADALGALALGATVVLWIGVEQRAPGLYDGGLAVVGVVSAALIFGAVTGGWLRRALAVRPLVALGKVSYGVYLYHFPLYLLLSEERVGLTGNALLGLRLAATLGLAMASYHLLECPIRFGRSVRGNGAVVGIATAAAVLALVTIPVGLSAQQDRVEASLGFDFGPEAFEPVQPPVATTGRPPAPGPGAAEPAVTEEAAVTGEPAKAAAAPTPTDPSSTATSTSEPAPPPRAPRIMVVGDSTAQANGPSLQSWGARTGQLQVATVASPGCAALHGPRFLVREGYTFEPEGCDTIFSAAARQARTAGADAIVVFIGSTQLADWELPGMEGWRHLGEPPVDDRYVAALAAAAETLSTAGVPVLWADVPTPAWDVDTFGALLGAGAAPGSGPVTLNDPARAARINQLDGQILPRHPLVQRWAYTEQLSGGTGTVSTDVRPDGLHVSEDAMNRLVEAGLLDVVAEAYRTVLQRAPAGMRPPASTLWNVSSPG